MIQPIFDSVDEPWVIMTGRYILNLGAVEAATRLLIEKITCDESSKKLNADLLSRIDFIRKKFPRENLSRHQWAMNVFNVAERQNGFRNIIAHSPIAISKSPGETIHILGILNLKPSDTTKDAELVSFEELKVRVNESAVLARDLLAMQVDFDGAFHG